MLLQQTAFGEDPAQMPFFLSEPGIRAGQRSRD